MGFRVRRWYISLVLGGIVFPMWEVGLYVVRRQSCHYDLSIGFFFFLSFSYFFWCLVFNVLFLIGYHCVFAHVLCSLCFYCYLVLCSSCLMFIMLLLLIGIHRIIIVA